MKKLESLILSGQPITGDGFKHLKGFDNLRELFVAKTQLHDQGIEQIVSSFPKLSRLQYFDTPVTTDGAYKLSSLLWLFNHSFPGEVTGPDFRTVPKEEREEFTKNLRMRKKEFATEYVRRYLLAKAEAKEQGKEVPPEFLWPFAAFVELEDVENAVESKSESN